MVFQTKILIDGKTVVVDVDSEEKRELVIQSLSQILKVCGFRCVYSGNAQEWYAEKSGTGEYDKCIIYPQDFTTANVVTSNPIRIYE